MVVDCDPRPMKDVLDVVEREDDAGAGLLAGHQMKGDRLFRLIQFTALR